MRARSIIARLVALVAVLVEAVAYRRQEAAVVALLAGSVVGGFAVDAWHRRAPALLTRLEAEPPRLAPVARTRAAPPARAPAPAARHGPRPAATPSPPAAATPLDLDVATHDQLARLPGLGPRLAARIVTRREELGGRFESFDQFARTPGVGRRRAGQVRALVFVPGEEAGAPGPPAEPGGVPP
jgi:DNA uptake protein ComE-like DNA-binding protein